jgi:hypothetical protein
MTGKSLVDIRAELKKQAELIKSKISAPAGDFIKVQQDKQFKLPDGTVSGGPLNVVILDFISANYFYDRPYKEGEIVPPACYALNDSPILLKPSEKSPVKQAEACNACPNDQFGSNGKGKACTNTRLLAVTAAGVPDAPIYLLKVSPTGIKAFDAYVKTIEAQFDGPPIIVETEIYFDKGSKWPSLRFGNPQPNTQLEAHFNMQKAAKDRLLTEPDVSQYTAPKGRKSK